MFARVVDWTEAMLLVEVKRPELALLRSEQLQ